MPDRTNRILLCAVLLSLSLCILAWLFEIRLLLILPSLPFFCVQLLLCRVTRRGWLRAVPFLCVAVFGLTGAWICLSARGWDTLLGLLMLFASISPVAGCALGWAAYGLTYSRRRRKE